MSPGSGSRRTVWDLPLRLFHWLLLLSVTAAIVSGKWGGAAYAHWHGRIGLLILGLLSFRLFWGLVGTRSARFLSFWPTPSRLRRYFSGQWQGIGHSPLAGLAVLGLLFVLGAQVLSGLGANDDIAFAGPLAAWLSKADSDALSLWHQRLSSALLAMIMLHLLAIACYELLFQHRLLLAMLSLRKRLNRERVAAAPAWRLLLALLLALASVYFVQQLGQVRTPAPQASVAAPAW